MAWSGSYTQFTAEGSSVTTEISGTGAWQSQVRCRMVTLTVRMESAKGILTAEILSIGEHKTSTASRHWDITVVAGSPSDVASKH